MMINCGSRLGEVIVWGDGLSEEVASCEWSTRPDNNISQPVTNNFPSHQAPFISYPCHLRTTNED